MDPLEFYFEYPSIDFLIAKQSSNSAEVIICTDGIANVGLGSYEEEE